MVQGFYLHRIWVFQRNRLVLGFLTLLITGNLVMQLVYVVLGSSSPTFELLRTNVKAVGMTVNAMTAVCDVSITILICRNLYRVKTGFAWTDRVVHQLVGVHQSVPGYALVILGCLDDLHYKYRHDHLPLCLFLPSFRTYLTIFCRVLLPCSQAIVLPNTLVYFGFYIISMSAFSHVFPVLFISLVGRLYQNSLLATLNARKALREATDHQSISMTNRRSSRSIHLTRETNGAVRIDCFSKKKKKLIHCACRHLQLRFTSR